MSAQTEAHRTLVDSLVHNFAMNHGKVTHADGVGTLPAPSAVGRHEPDVLARAELSGTLLIGEAKQGDDLFSEHSQEQLHDFSTYVETGGEHAALVLAVPKGWKPEAERAVTAAGGALDWTSVLEVEFPGAPPPPGS